MKRGPKKSPATAKRRREIQLADAWLRYFQKLTVLENRIQILEGKTCLSSTAIRHALSAEHDWTTRLEIQVMREMAVNGIAVNEPELLRET